MSTRNETLLDKPPGRVQRALERGLVSLLVLVTGYCLTSFVGYTPWNTSMWSKWGESINWSSYWTPPSTAQARTDEYPFRMTTFPRSVQPVGTEVALDVESDSETYLAFAIRINNKFLIVTDKNHLDYRWNTLGYEPGTYLLTIQYISGPRHLFALFNHSMIIRLIEEE